MKLDEWLNGKIQRIISGAFKKSEMEDLHVIGTCGKCEHRNKFSQCVNPKGHVDTAPSNFGCIHFKAKE